MGARGTFSLTRWRTCAACAARRPQRPAPGQGWPCSPAGHSSNSRSLGVWQMAQYAVIFRRSALVTAVAAVIMVVLSAAVGGAKGLLGALVGVGLVVVFFGISAIAMSWAARKSPQVTMVTAVSTYLVKIIALLFLVARYS